MLARLDGGSGPALARALCPQAPENPEHSCVAYFTNPRTRLARPAHAARMGAKLERCMWHQRPGQKSAGTTCDKRRRTEPEEASSSQHGRSTGAAAGPSGTAGADRRTEHRIAVGVDDWRTGF